ncbi:hypothetical protein HDV00_000902 [Rhizophlyctis rosea]|nr:hypothetical protein HDV00_000902 [Rhizophlyctis rosea]
MSAADLPNEILLDILGLACKTVDPHPRILRAHCLRQTSRQWLTVIASNLPYISLGTCHPLARDLIASFLAHATHSNLHKLAKQAVQHDDCPVPLLELFISASDHLYIINTEEYQRTADRHGRKAAAVRKEKFIIGAALERDPRLKKFYADLDAVTCSMGALRLKHRVAFCVRVHGITL